MISSFNTLLGRSLLSIGRNGQGIINFSAWSSMGKLQMSKREKEELKLKAIEDRINEIKNLQVSEEEVK